MSEITFVVEQLNSIHYGPAWHGPSLSEILSGITFEDAFRKPIQGAHSIFDLVHHIAAWQNVFAIRLEGNAIDEPAEGDFPAADFGSPEDWAAALQRLEDSHQRIVRVISSLEGADLEQVIPGKEYTRRLLVFGSIPHNVYHSGQIVIVKKSLNL